MSHLRPFQPYPFPTEEVYPSKYGNRWGSIRDLELSVAVGLKYLPDLAKKVPIDAAALRNGVVQYKGSNRGRRKLLLLLWGEDKDPGLLPQEAREEFVLLQATEALAYVKEVLAKADLPADDTLANLERKARHRLTRLADKVPAAPIELPTSEPAVPKAKPRPAAPKAKHLPNIRVPVPIAGRSGK